MTFLGLRGRKDNGGTTRKVMASVMKTALAQQFNFLGHSAKHAFMALQLKDVVAGLYIKSTLLQLSVWVR